MKIRVRKKAYEQAMALPRSEHEKPRVPSALFRFALHALSLPDVWACKVQFNKIGMEKLGDQPCLILMNHSCFLDLKMASVLFADRPFNIVCTTDGFVGKSWLMRLLGCIPTQKYVTDLSLVRDIFHAIHKNNCSVLMYPEAGYSFDGTATALPDSVGKLVKMLGAPLVTVITHGAFARDPLYNGLQRRKVQVSADVKYLLSPEEIKGMTAAQINEKLSDEFSFDNFAWQAENKIAVREKFRADGLDRVLYKCPHCLAEGKMEGKGIYLRCNACGKTYELDEYGRLQAPDAIFTHVPDWYAWERQCVREEIESGAYKMEADVDICLLLDYKALYRVGEGCLTHDGEGFRLTGCDGKLDYSQSPLSSHSLNSDFFWYELGDVICIGDKNCLYYCFPKDKNVNVAKARLAAEELYKIKKS